MITEDTSYHLKSFFPICYIAMSSIILFIGGLIGSLNAGVWTVFFFTAALLSTIIYLVATRKISYKSLIPNSALIFFIISVIWLYWGTRNAAVIHTDDFSHWYKICKIMHYESAFPTTPDLLFPSYIPGTAVWIYFITSIIGFSPANCFFAQGLINIAALTSLFSLLDKMKGKTKLLAAILLISSAITLCSVTETTYVLLVDVPLGLTTGAVLVMILSDAKRNMLFSISAASVLTLIILIKVSGILFIVAGIFLLFINDRKRSIKTCITTSIFTAIAAISLPALYLLRNNKYFGDLAETEQGLSTSRFLSVYSSKTPENIKETITYYIKTIFTMGFPSPQILVIWAALFALLIIFLISKHNKTSLVKENRTILIFTAVILFIYWAALLATYLFSMSELEANGEFLASFNRYNGTITIFVLFMLVRQTIRNTELITKASTKSVIYIAASVTILTIGITSFNFTYLLGSRKYICDEKYYTSVPWDVCIANIPEIYEYNEDRYFVIYDESVFENDFRNKLEWMMVTHLRSIHIRCIGMQDLINGNISESNYNYLEDNDYIVAFGNDEFQNLLKQYLPPDNYVYLNDM